MQALIEFDKQSVLPIGQQIASQLVEFHKSVRGEESWRALAAEAPRWNPEYVGILQAMANSAEVLWWIPAEFRGLFPRFRPSLGPALRYGALETAMALWSDRERRIELLKTLPASWTNNWDRFIKERFGMVFNKGMNPNDHLQLELKVADLIADGKTGLFWMVPESHKARVIYFVKKSFMSARGRDREVGEMEAWITTTCARYGITNEM